MHFRQQCTISNSLVVIIQLIPLYVCVAIGGAGAIFYLSRLALRNPDVAWRNKADMRSNQEYANKQYKVGIVLNIENN